ncbi:MAG: carboxypeptidase-like regulatory domain-containing protein [Planctomycetaceae bacterium]|jgi:hypothetical protein|nr:carboxypeptidase-like regulatory domain-containing protein [Planctomycetaceae bacterium]
MKKLFLSFILLCAVGCGQKMVSVSGTVTLDGKPIQDCRVLFQAKRTGESEIPVVDASGLTNSEGQFQLSSLGERIKLGAIPGDYVVKFGWCDPNPPLSESETPTPPPYQIPQNMQLQGLPFTIPKGGTSNANFDLKSK